MIRGFALDAHYKEPTKKNDPLLKLDNVLCTPHIAGSTYDTYLRVINVCLNNITNALKNKKIEYMIR